MLKYTIIIGAWALITIVLGSAYTGVLFSRKMSLSVQAAFTELETFVKCLEEIRCRVVTMSMTNSYYLMLTAPGSELSARVRNSFRYSPALVIPQAEAIFEAILREQ